MSIIQKAKDRNRSMAGYSRNKKNEDNAPTQNPKILDLSKLKDYVSKVVEFNKTKATNVESYRKFQYVFEWPIANILGAVDEPTWVYMIESALEWCIDNYGSVQLNGRWEVYDFEINIDSRVVSENRYVGKDEKGNVNTQNFSKQYDYLVLGVEFVDVKGEQDMVFEMGRPTTNKGNFDPEMLKYIMKNAPNSVGQVDDESKKLIESQAVKLKEQEGQIAVLREQQEKSNALMAELLAEMKKSSTTKTTRSKK